MPEGEIDRLIRLLAALPGLGPRSARRAALHLIRRREQAMLPLAEALQTAATSLGVCPGCGNLDTVSPCGICADPRRDPRAICVVEDTGDLWAVERTHIFRGRYHVLGGTLSALDGVKPEDLNVASLVERARDPALQEIIIATGATVAGQATAHYVHDRLASCDVTVSRLAHGVPVGGELDYLDDGTLTAALAARHAM